MATYKQLREAGLSDTKLAAQDLSEREQRQLRKLVRRGSGPRAEAAAHVRALELMTSESNINLRFYIRTGTRP